uniref:Uncharacterized protein n=2 Tax=Loa loa TaxID=7209 RepID=A0A1I7VGH8_LOALO
MQFIQKLFLKNALSPNERNFNRRHRNKVVVSNKYSENETTEASNNSRNNSAATDYDEMTAFSEIFESRSCLTETDFVRCAIHILLWCTASTSTVYLLYTWEYAWRYTEFKAKIPKQFYMAMIFSVTNVIIYSAEIFHSKWLYVRFRLVTKPDKMEEPYELAPESYERTQAGKEMDTAVAVATAAAANPMKDLKPEEHFLIPISKRV